MARNRFTNTASLELQEVNRSPIFGYQHLPISTLEQAIDKIIPLVSGIVGYVANAKENCNRNSTLLTWNESAAIYLYSMSIPFFSRLNTALRAENRQELKPWLAFLKLFITALEKLPPMKGTVWRGIDYDDTLSFVDNDMHIWWSINSCSMALNIVQPFLGERGTLFAIDAIHGKDISGFSAIPDEQEVVLMPGTRVRARYQSLSFIDRLFVIHLEEENSQSELQMEPSYLFELIKQEYQRNSRIERIMNPSKSFPIEQSYINLAIVETKEQQEKEKKLLNVKFNNEIIGTYEEIYGMKTKIEISNIFEKCKDHTKNILVLGRAGIGKTTFCRYAAYQWATGAIWQQYQLVLFIRLRRLTEGRYPALASGVRYSLIDLVKTEYCCHNLTEKDERLFKEQFDSNQVLWLLDGYDEIVQNLPPHLHYLVEQLLKTPHHILTTRPYLNTLSYDVQLEVIGFTDDNIKEYVKQFFDHITDEIDNALLQAQKLLSFLKCNPRIWGIVHIPVNLELICSLWCDTEWSDTTTLTMTTVYDKMIEWLCRWYLKKQHISSSQMTKEDIYEYCCKELTFLESLAYKGMKNNAIILRPQLLRAASKETNCSLQHQSHLLNIGILKSLDYKPVGTHIEADKSHYFLHLSFQEHFTARYLVKALHGSADQKKMAIDFIKIDKYNRHFELVLTFASGLLTDSNDEQSMTLFWDALLGEPLDLIGLRHVQIVIACLEEAGCDRHLPRFRESINLIIKWIKYSVYKKHDYLYINMEASLRRCPLLVNQSEIHATLVALYRSKDLNVQKYAYFLICDLPISNPDFDLIHLHLAALNNEEISVRQIAYTALGKMGEKAATTEVINRLMSALEDTNDYVRWKACETLGKLGEKAVNNEMINRLVTALGDTNQYIRCNACEALGKLGGKASTDEVINRLVTALGDPIHGVRLIAGETLQKMNEQAPHNEIVERVIGAFVDPNPVVRQSACEVVGKLDSKAATNEVINRLICALGDTNPHMRRNACEALGKLGEKTATDGVINGLMNALGDTNHYIRRHVCEVFAILGEKAAVSGVMNRLVRAAEDNSSDVRRKACVALGKLSGKVVTNEVIDKLVHVLEDANADVRHSACEALGNIGEKAATNEVISKLSTTLEDVDDHVRRSAYAALGKVGEKAATNEVIGKLMNAFGDTDDYVRRIACEAIGRMGVNAATSEVFEKLVGALEDGDDYVRRNACEALGKLSETEKNNEVFKGLMHALDDESPEVRRSACENLYKTTEEVVDYEVISRLVRVREDSNLDVRASAYKALEMISEKGIPTEVINKIVSAFEDTNPNIRRHACKVIVRLGEKAATNEVVNRLLQAMEDSNREVRHSASVALCEIGDKAATDAAIHRLVNALRDTDDYVRYHACEALGNMGEKVATNEVINALTNALRDTNHYTRRNACIALGKIGAKAATNEVINAVVSVLQDRNPDVRRNANVLLCQIAGKAASSELIRQLLEICNDKNPEVQYAVLETTENILSMLSCMSQLDAVTVEELSLFLKQSNRNFLTKISPKKFVKAFLDTKISSWLPIIKQTLVLQGNAVTMMNDTMTLYGNNEAVELSVVDMELKQLLRDALVNWMDELSERCDLPYARDHSTDRSINMIPYVRQKVAADR